MYNSLQVKPDFIDASTQCEDFDHGFIFNEMLKVILKENNLKDDIISQNLTMGLFYDYFDFIEKIK